MVVQPTGIWWTVPIFKVYCASKLPSECLIISWGTCTKTPSYFASHCVVCFHCVSPPLEKSWILPGTSILFCKVQAKLKV